MAIALLTLCVAAVISTATGLNYENIVSGNEVTLNQFPYQVYIQIGSKSCSGALIDQKFVLTAAQCVNNIKNDVTVTVYAGVINTNGEILKRAQHQNVKDIYLPPGFQSHSIPSKGGKIELFSNDIAVLKLEKELKGSNIGKVKVHDTVKKFNKPIYVSGFGWYINNVIESAGQKPKNSGITNGLLKWAQVASTGRELPVENIFEGHTIRTSKTSQDHKPCLGDIGSPLVVDGTIIGVLSKFNNGCTKLDDDIAYYTKVLGFSEFIKKAMNNKIEGSYKTATAKDAKNKKKSL